MLHIKFPGHHSICSGEEVLFFDHVWAWWPYWLCDQDGLNIFLFSLPREALYKIKLVSLVAFEEMLKMSKYQNPRLKVK